MCIAPQLQAMHPHVDDNKRLPVSEAHYSSVIKSYTADGPKKRGKKHGGATRLDDEFKATATDVGTGRCDTLFGVLF